MFSQGYIIDSQICATVLYLFYILILKEHIAHSWARVYLLLALPLALIIPLLEIPLLPSVATLPVVVYQQTTPITEAAVPTISVSTINYILIAYLAGVTLMMIWMSVGAIRLSKLIRNSRAERIDGLRIIFTSQQITAYSVFNYIFINQAIRNSDILEELLAHERVHIKLRHTLDLIFMGLIRCLFWFNPAVWHIGILLRKIHEYQADAQVIEQGYSIKKYVQLLILAEVGINPEFASPLSYALTKNRIKMLARKEKIANRKRLALTIPVLIVLLVSFSLTTRAAEETTIIIPQQEVDNQTQQAAEETTIIIPEQEIDNQTQQVAIHTKNNLTTDDIQVKMFSNKESKLSNMSVKVYKEDENNSGIITVITDRVKKTQEIEIMPFGSKIDNTTILINGEEVEALPLNTSNIKTLGIIQNSTTKEKIIHIVTSETQPISENDNSLFTVTEIMPKFQNGNITKFQKWAVSSLNYPQVAVDNKVQSDVIVQFIIKTDGTLSNSKIISSSNKYLSRKDLRVINRSEKLTPGK